MTKFFWSKSNISLVLLPKKTGSSKNKRMSHKVRLRFVAALPSRAITRAQRAARTREFPAGVLNQYAGQRSFFRDKPGNSGRVGRSVYSVSDILACMPIVIFSHVRSM